ncbi:unnamed protein product [Aphanomyces euteiches]
MARLIEATMILHNWYIDLQEVFEGPGLELEDVPQEEWMHIGGDEILSGFSHLDHPSANVDFQLFALLSLALDLKGNFMLTLA